MSARVATGGVGGDITFYDGSETLLGKITVDPQFSSGWQGWYTTPEITLNLQEGTNRIKTAFSGGSGFLFNVNYYQLEVPEGISSSTPVTENPVSVFPNPVTDYASFNLGNNELLSSVSFFDAQGRLVKSATLENSNQVNIADLQSGIYYVLVYDYNGITYPTKLFKK